jgi:hypothetical protein
MEPNLKEKEDQTNGSEFTSKWRSTNESEFETKGWSIKWA